MSDNLAIIRRVLEEHQALRRNMKLVGDSITDQEATSSLQGAQADWIPGRPQILAEKQKKLKQTLSFLDEGLKNHFAFEEEALPSLLGELFMRALILDHREIIGEIEEAQSIVADIKIEGLNRDELLLKEARIKQEVDGIYELVEGHTTREEIMLDMVSMALEDQGENKD